MPSSGLAEARRGGRRRTRPTSAAHLFGFQRRAHAAHRGSHGRSLARSPPRRPGSTPRRTLPRPAPCRPCPRRGFPFRLRPEGRRLPVLTGISGPKTLDPDVRRHVRCDESYAPASFRPSAAPRRGKPFRCCRSTVLPEDPRRLGSPDPVKPPQPQPIRRFPRARGHRRLMESFGRLPIEATGQGLVSPQAPEDLRFAETGHVPPT